MRHGAPLGAPYTCPQAEPGFLLQGALRALVAPNRACRAFRNGPPECTDPAERPGGAYMDKGDVAWAGGSAKRAAKSRARAAHEGQRHIEARTGPRQAGGR